MIRLRQALPPGPLDIVGDVHGEIDALRALVRALGGDPDSGRLARPLVFVGDLVDRGPDSVAVVRFVRDLVARGAALAVIGNHELNLLQRDHKEGNGWFFGHNDGYPWRVDGVAGRRPFDSVEVRDPKVNDEIRSFLASLPVTLERDDLRIVHACWDAAALSMLPDAGDVASLADEAEERVFRDLEANGWLRSAERERQHFADLRDPDVRPDRPLPAVQEVADAEQQLNPFRVLTSGREERIPFEHTYFVGGKWRVVRRARWWAGYEEAPAVVVGHYWRRRAPVEDKPDLWDEEAPFGWAGPRRNVFCVDYSVGRRFLGRWRGTPSGGPALAALRWPERVVVFDDDPTDHPTTGFLGAPNRA